MVWKTRPNRVAERASAPRNLFPTHQTRKGSKEFLKDFSCINFAYQTFAQVMGDHFSPNNVIIHRDNSEIALAMHGNAWQAVQ